MNSWQVFNVCLLQWHIVTQLGFKYFRVIVSDKNYGKPQAYLRLLVLILLFSIGCFIETCQAAQEQQTEPQNTEQLGEQFRRWQPYVGLSIGEWQVDAKNFDEDYAIEYYFGIKITKLFSVELGGFGGVAEVVDDNELLLYSYTLAGAIQLPVYENVELVAKVGVHYWDTELKLPDSCHDSVLCIDGETIEENSGNDSFYNIGINWRYGDGSSIGLAYSRYKFEYQNEEISSGYTSIQFMFRF
ncbi:hypothetical protein E2K93_01880 [Thalassotalea sp. HSM 43]|uniref:outer membrane beta-barrel protein n=1 Tax=Thalassotalea sp. HSM 43 TaxID=2552945 RepID=UPI0010812683|nr:outer membrane beta-barrel protein [Thalassotalea sp. HSM 43]QBY03193.1 hypothetical protein E2K93_01880 [Thalassotalea sp. HSM 43]